MSIPSSPRPPARARAVSPGATKRPRKTAPTSARPSGGGRPERWTVSAGDAAQATLVIPADAVRERRFEIACAATVTALVEAVEPWHQMTVQADGEHQWQRRVPSHSPGQFDGLDYRFSRSVPVGRALRITVAVACQGARRRQLVIEADEV
jgi:hypothetical protein